MAPRLTSERLLLDTSTLIAAERGVLDLSSIAPEDADAALPAIVVAEYLTGVDSARTEQQRLERAEFLGRVLGALPVEDYTARVAEAHAALLAHVRRSGTKRGAHDLIIAATARSTGRVIISTDAHARFDELPGVTARLIA